MNSRVRGRLAWRIYNASPTDAWEFRLNGRRIKPENISSETRFVGHPVRTNVELPAHVYFETDFTGLSRLAFRNALEITPTRLESGYDAERTMEVVEAWAEDV